LMSIIGLMFIFKSWLGSTLSFDCHCTFYLRDIGCIIVLYFHIVISALFCAAVEEQPMRRRINKLSV
jgi:F-type H+-transporting ATPase subunit a